MTYVERDGNAFLLSSYKGADQVAVEIGGKLIPLFTRPGSPLRQKADEDEIEATHAELVGNELIVLAKMNEGSLLAAKFDPVTGVAVSEYNTNMQWVQFDDPTIEESISFSSTEQKQFFLKEFDSIINPVVNTILSANKGSTLLGTSSVDSFIFDVVSNSPRGKSRVKIKGFNGAAGDKIDISSIDANIKSDGFQQFRFIGTKKFSGAQGEIRFSRGILQLDNNLDRKADLEIGIIGAKGFQADFLVLSSII